MAGDAEMAGINNNKPSSPHSKPVQQPVVVSGTGSSGGGGAGADAGAGAGGTVVGGAYRRGRSTTIEPDRRITVSTGGTGTRGTGTGTGTGTAAPSKLAVPSGKFMTEMSGNKPGGIRNRDSRINSSTQISVSDVGTSVFDRWVDVRCTWPVIATIL